MVDEDSKEIARQVSDFLDEIGLEPSEIPDKKPDEKYLLETKELELEKLRIENANLKQEQVDKTEYAKKIFYLIVYWLAAILFLIFLDGLGEVELSDKVIITLISGTTINILALFIIVAKYLYRIPEKTKDGMS